MARRPPVEPPAAIVDTTAALASLYQAPLAEFIARRTALVKDLRRSGHKDVAARIAASVKPSRAAFLVNQVYWTAREEYDAVLDAGTAARAAQQARLLGDDSSDLAERLAWRDQAVDAAVARADAIARADGQPMPASLRAQVRASFEALAAHGREGRLAHGHLTADVALPGLGAFAGLVMAPESAAGPVRKFAVVARRKEEPSPAPVAPDPQIVEQEARVAQLRTREADAVARLEEVTRAVTAATEVVERARAEAEAAAKRLAEAEASCSDGEKMRAAAQADVERLTTEREKAERRLSELQAPRPGPRGRGGPRGRR